MPSQPTARAARPATRRRNGQDLTHISKLGDGRWMAKIPDGHHPDTGKLLYKLFKYVELDRVIEARDAYLKRRKEEQRPRLIGRQAPAMTVAVWLTIALEHGVKNDNAARTYEKYKYLIDTYVIPALGAIELPKLTQTRVEQWRDELKAEGRGTATINLALAAFKTLLERAALPARWDETGIKVNVARKVRPLKRTADAKLRDYVTSPDETIRLIEAAGESYLAAIPQVATDLGLRRSEISTLMHGDFDLDAGTVTIKRHAVKTMLDGARKIEMAPGTKSSKGEWHTLRLTPESIAALRLARRRLIEFKLAQGKAWRAGQLGEGGYRIPQDPTAPDALVFPRADGGIFDPNALNMWFMGVCKRAGITTKSLHSLRHDCATFLLSAGVPLTVVSNHMRHANPEITARVYAHLLKEQDTLAVDTLSGIWRARGAAVAV